MCIDAFPAQEPKQNISEVVAFRTMPSLVLL
jgi:hypothetical protein